MIRIKIVSLFVRSSLSKKRGSLTSYISGPNPLNVPTLQVEFSLHASDCGLSIRLFFVSKSEGRTNRKAGGKIAGARRSSLLMISHRLGGTSQSGVVDFHAICTRKDTDVRWDTTSGVKLDHISRHEFLRDVLMRLGSMIDRLCAERKFEIRSLWQAVIKFA